MLRRKRRRRVQEIPQSSLSDLAFLLLMFFITSMDFTIEQGLPFVLPSAQRSVTIEVEPGEVFRVQILATSSEQSAMEAKKRVEKKLGFAAYVSFVDGMYKVRVGDCSSREEADKVRERCRGAGYSDAWIVTDVMKGP